MSNGKEDLLSVIRVAIGSYYYAEGSSVIKSSDDHIECMTKEVWDHLADTAAYRLADGFTALLDEGNRRAAEKRVIND